MISDRFVNENSAFSDIIECAENHNCDRSSDVGANSHSDIEPETQDPGDIFSAIESDVRNQIASGRTWNTLLLGTT